MRRTQVVTIGLALLLVGGSIGTSLAAQGGGQRGRLRGKFMPQERILRALDFTEDQRTQAQSLRENFQTALVSLREQRRENAQALRTALESEEPSAVEIGELLIAQKNLREQTPNTRERFQEDFKALLTAEQLERLERFQDRRWRGSRRSASRLWRGL